MGLRPRTDAKIELDPIDIGWDHFTANNIRYRDRDLTITWDAPGRHATTTARACPTATRCSSTASSPSRSTRSRTSSTTRRPARSRSKARRQVTTSAASAVQAPQDVRFADDARVVDLFAKAGADIATDEHRLREPRRRQAGHPRPSRPAAARRPPR